MADMALPSLLLTALRTKAVARRLRRNFRAHGILFNTGIHDPTVVRVARALMHLKVPGSFRVQEALDEATAELDLSLSPDQLQAEAVTLRDMWLKLRCSRRARRFLGYHEPMASCESGESSLDSHDFALRHELTRLQEELDALPPLAGDVPPCEEAEDNTGATHHSREDVGTDATEDGSTGATHQDLEAGTTLREVDDEGTVHLQQDEDPGAILGEELVAQLQPAENADSSAREDPAPRGPSAANAAPYRRFIAIWKASDLIQALPAACHWPACRGLWAEHTGKPRVALLRLNETLLKAQQPTVEGFGRLNMRAMLVDLAERVRGVEARPGCPRCRYNPNGCPPSCRERRRLEAERAALRAAEATAAGLPIMGELGLPPLPLPPPPAQDADGEAPSAAPDTEGEEPTEAEGP